MSAENEQIPENLTGKVFNLADLVKHQEGAVVSRMLINKKVGSVTIFSFDKGQGLSEHTAPYDAMVTVIDGEAEINIAGKRYLVRTGETIIMPAGKTHSLTARKNFKMTLTMIRS
jgi:quercetin dioxygenase-like cupin family protein